MPEAPTTVPVARKSRWRWLRFSLRTWIVLVGIVGVVVGTQFRQSTLTTRNVRSLRPVASLDKVAIWRIAWSPLRDRMAVVGWETPVEIRDSFTLSPIEKIGAGKKIIGFAFGPTEDLVAYCENGTTAVILDRRTGKSLVVDGKDAQPDLAFSPDGTLLFTGGYGTTVRAWKVADGSLLKTFDVGAVTGGLTVEVSRDGRLLAVGNRNSVTSLFDVATGKLLYTLPKQSSHELQFSPDGKALAVVYVDGSLALWRVADGALLFGRKTTAEELYALDWSPDGGILATAGAKGPITLWDPRDLSVLRELPAPPWVIRVKFSPDGLNLHYAGGSGSVGTKQRLEVLGVESSLFSILGRRK